MHRKTPRLLALIAASLLALTLTGAALADQPGPVPAELAQNARPLSQVDLQTMPRQDNEALLAAAIARSGPGIAPRFAQAIEVNLTPQNSGTWEHLPDGRQLWRLRIRSPKAVSLNLGFERYQMPPDGRLYLYAAGYSQVIGPFDAADNEEHGQLWTPLIESEEIVIELVLPATQVADLNLTLSRVNHGFIDFFSAPQLSGACNLDVVCSAADGFPQVDAWRDQIRAVGAYSISGVDYCSGTLVNNTAQDLTPYFLTANHCLSSAASAAAVVIYWNYENSTCRPPGSAASGGPGDGSRAQFSSGTSLVATYNPSDFTLLRLDDPLPEDFGPHWAGWDARDQATSSAVGIHHPGVEEKRISFENDPTSITNYLNSTPDPNGTHLRITDWDTGTTEGGSSGSGLFSPDGYLIGQLTGGYAACENDSSDWYGRLAVSWNGGGTADSRLKDWLDPAGGGSALQLAGRDAVAFFNLTADPASQAICAPADAVYTMTVTTVQGFSDPVTFSASSIPAGASASFSPNPLDPPGSSQLTIGDTGAAAPGAYAIEISGISPTATHTVTVGLDIAFTAPAAPALTSPADNATAVSILPTFNWDPADGASSYTVEVARDPAFAGIVISAGGLETTSYSPATALDTNTTYYWRVSSGNGCGTAVSPAFSFVTQPGPGDCGPGTSPHLLFLENFDGSPTRWSRSGIGATWIITTANPHSGSQSYHAVDSDTVSDQLLTAPAVSLPAGETPLSLKYWNYQAIENSSAGCFDGGFLEISSDGGATWTQLDAELLTDPYDGSISSNFGNPLAGHNAWCGDPQDWTQSIVDLSAFAGEQVRLRFRLATDDSVGREGWTIDDFTVQSCQGVPTAVTLNSLQAGQPAAPPASLPLGVLPAITALSMAAAALLRRRR